MSLKTNILSDYQKMVLKTIGISRFLSKFFTVILKKIRLFRAKNSRPLLYKDVFLTCNKYRSPMAGKWFYNSIAIKNKPNLSKNEKQILKKAQLAKLRIFYINGRKINLSSPPQNGRWDVDPDSGNRWPCISIFEPLKNTAGDVRYPWELGRMHHLVWFGQAWRLTGDKEWIKEALIHLNEIMNESPYEYGIHWRDGLQLSVRIFSLIALADLCHDAENTFHVEINKAISAHVFSLRRQISPHGEITNNHVIGEASAQTLSGLFLQNESDVKKGLDRLHLELKRQIYADGIPYEGSIPYIRFDLDFLLLLLMALRSVNRDTPSWLIKYAAIIASALARVADSKGMVPPIGDGDDARVIRLDDEAYLCVNESLNLASYLTGESIAYNKPLSGFCDWICGPTNNSLLDSSIKKINHLKDSGLIHIYQKKINVWVDCGPTGGGVYGPGVHGHNDTTAIVLHYNGRALLHDPGWHTYYGDIDMRNQLRSTGAHNGVMVNKLEQAELGSLFEIANQCHPLKVRTRQKKSVACVTCGHDGYTRLNKGISYIRHIMLSGDGPWLLRVTDKVKSNSKIEVSMHLGSNFLWKKINNNKWALPGGHVWSGRRGCKDVESMIIPYSEKTGILKSGSAIEWNIPLTVKNQCEYSYVCQWEFKVY
jgi:hypothetical protein